MPRIIMILGSARERSTNLNASLNKGRPRGIANENRFRNFIRQAPPANGSKGFSQSMPERRNVFITGGTGFLGSHLAARLLHSRCHLTALARGTKSTSAQTRVAEVLRDVGVTEFENLKVVEGDISLPDLGLNE